MTKDEALNMAMERFSIFGCEFDKEITAIKEALAQPEQRNSRYILMITTAYEQGVGKGHQAFLRKRKIDNPYVEGDCFDAWQMGYREGTKQAKDIEAKT